MVRIKNTCNIPGCDKFVVTKGLCDKHRKRLERHGSTEQTRPKDWGGREKHPLIHSYRGHCRNHYKLLCKEWREDFWQFVKDVGEKPSRNHSLRRINTNKEYSADNCHWVESIPRSSIDRKIRAEYCRAWRDANRDKCRDTSLKKTHGISLNDYNRILSLQDAVCAICKQPEFAINPRTKEIRALAVDHNHNTDDIRGLLCTNCNKALGHFKEKIEFMKTAIAYLEKEPVIRLSKKD